MTKNELLLLSRARRYAESGEGRDLRIAAGLSLREVADAVGVASHTLWKWERGERAPRAAGATVWAAFLNDLSRQSA
jgi:transcriptional regulator with XRE-family HTH domain